MYNNFKQKQFSSQQTFYKLSKLIKNNETRTFQECIIIVSNYSEDRFFNERKKNKTCKSLKRNKQ